MMKAFYVINSGEVVENSMGIYISKTTKIR